MTGDTVWTRHGECNHCGHCCQFIARQPIVRTPRQVRRDEAFYRTRGFQPVQVDGEPRLVLWAWLCAPCPEHRDDRCAVHATRPQTCRDFPRLPSDIVGTSCSYYFEREGVFAGGEGSPHPTTEAELVQLEAA